MILLFGVGCLRKNVVNPKVPLPADRITYVIERDPHTGQLFGTHRDKKGKVILILPNDKLDGRKAVDVGWWAQIYNWCEVKDLEDSR